jgi:hypothetical protein
MNDYTPKRAWQGPVALFLRAAALPIVILVSFVLLVRGFGISPAEWTVSLTWITVNLAIERSIRAH